MPPAPIGTITFVFTGKVAGNQMSGALDMGEYLGAKWSASRKGFSLVATI